MVHPLSDSTTMLTKYQIDHYEAFGFLALRGLLSQEEIEELRAASSSVMRQLRGTVGAPADANQSLQPWLERHPSMRDLIDDERIHQIPESLLGPDFWLDGADGHLRAGDTPWHGSDGHDDDLGWVKVAIYLDPLNRDSGRLRVIPGAHRWHGADLFAALRKVDQSKDFRPFGMRADEIGSVALETEPGDVLVFTERLIHRAFGDGIGRYQVCANFVANPETERHIAQIEQFYDASTWSLRPTRTYVESDRPRIRRMAQEPLKWGSEVLDC